MKTYTNDTPCPREFDCRHCGEHVVVTEHSDRRTVYCCQHCEKQYWREMTKRDRRKKISRGHVTRLEIEHRQNRREEGF